MWCEGTESMWTIGFCPLWKTSFFLLLFLLVLLPNISFLTIWYLHFRSTLSLFPLCFRQREVFLVTVKIKIIRNCVPVSDIDCGDQTAVIQNFLTGKFSFARCQWQIIGTIPRLFDSTTSPTTAVQICFKALGLKIYACNQLWLSARKCASGHIWEKQALTRDVSQMFWLSDKRRFLATFYDSLASEKEWNVWLRWE